MLSTDPTVEYAVFENEDHSYEIIRGSGRVALVAGWERMVAFFRDRVKSGLATSATPVQLWIGQNRLASVDTTVGSVSRFR